MTKDRMEHLQDMYVEYHKNHWKVELEQKIERLKRIKANPKYIKKLEDKLNENKTT